MGTLIVLAVLALVVFLAARSLFRTRKSGCCSGSCGSCHGCSGDCHPDAKHTPHEE